MANRHRGDVDCLIDGRRHTLRLTLQALAEIEEAFGADGLAALGQRLAKGLRTRDLTALLAAALRGGGATLSDEEVGALAPASDLPVIADALQRLLVATFGAEADRPLAKAR